jgi:hypothetical protein
MSYPVQTALNDLAGIVHGTTTNKIPNVSGALNRAARAVLLDVDPKETQRIVSLAQVFNDVYDYAAPVDLKGDRMVDLRPQAGRIPSDIFTQDYAQTFDANKSFNLNNAIYTQWNTGVKTLRIEADTLTAPVTITDTGSTTSWTATTGASTITLDTTANVAGGGALTFNLLAGSATGYIENTALTALDLTAHQNVSTLFLWVYLPLGSSVTGVTLRLGSDTTANYYSLQVTQTQQGVALQTGWNLLAFPWASMTKTGTPVITAIDSVRVTFAYDSTLQTGVKICNLTSNLGYIFQLQYYSKYLFRSAAGTFQETVDVTNGTDTTALINLDTESYNLFFNKFAYFVAQQLQGADAEYDAQYWLNEYTTALTRYKALNPSEAMVKGETYYSMPKKGYGRFSGGPWPH